MIEQKTALQITEEHYEDLDYYYELNESEDFAKEKGFDKEYIAKESIIDWIFDEIRKLPEPIDQDDEIQFAIEQKTYYKIIRALTEKKENEN